MSSAGGSIERQMREVLSAAGLAASVLVRDLDTEAEVGLEPERELPIASLVKVPLAVATLERIRRAELDGAAPIRVAPGLVTTPGPAGISRFRHPARIAIDDLLYLSTSLSDNAAADALFDLTPPSAVTDLLHRAGIGGGITVRHRMAELTETLVEDLGADHPDVAHLVAIRAGTPGGGHRVPQLDLSRANTGSARALVDLLAALWRPLLIDETVARRVRELMATGIHRQRLAPEFISDATRWSSKTGTMLNLRHEIGVVEHIDHRTYAVAVLTESNVAAANQPAAEAAMAYVARALRDHVREAM